MSPSPMCALKKYICASLLFAGMFFVACGDDGSSSSANNGRNGEDTEIDLDNIEITYDITVNKKSQVIKLEVIDENDKDCVQENGKYEWKSVEKAPSIDSVKYDFLGDTLVIFRMERDSDEDSSLEPEFATTGRMYVGGKSGKLDGTWKSMACQYSSIVQSIYCDQETEDGFYVNGYKYELKFSGNSLAYMRKSRVLELNYTETLFRNKLLEYLEEGSIYSPQIGSIFYSQSEKRKDLKRIELKEQSATGETFTLDDSITVVVNVKKYENFSESRRLATIEIIAKGDTCVGTYESASVLNSEFCKDENAGNFTTRYKYDANGEQYTGVVQYEKNESTKFNICLDNIFLDIPDVGDFLID